MNKHLLCIVCTYCVLDKDFVEMNCLLLCIKIFNISEMSNIKVLCFLCIPKVANPDNDRSSATSICLSAT